jgi:hypothetical protein
MKDQGWAAAVTALGQEHLAHNECRRFCLTCYLPQRRIRVWPKGATELVLWAVPLIRGRLLLPLAALSHSPRIGHFRWISHPRRGLQMIDLP